MTLDGDRRDSANPKVTELRRETEGPTLAQAHSAPTGVAFYDHRNGVIYEIYRSN